MSAVPPSAVDLGSPAVAATAVEAVAVRRASAAKRWALFSLALDAAMLATAVVLSQFGAHAARGIAPVPLAWALLFPALVLGALGASGHYRPRLRLDFLDDARRIVLAAAVGAMSLITLEVVSGETQEVAMHALRPWVFATVFLLAGRAGLIWSEVQERRVGAAGAPALVVGADPIGRLVGRRLAEHPELGLRPLGFVDDEVAGEDILGRCEELERLVAERGVEHVVVAYPDIPPARVRELMERCWSLGLRVSVVPRLYETVTASVSVEHLGGIPLLSAARPDPHGWHFAVKHALDRVLAALLLAAFAPVMLASALAVWASLGRPIFFRQRRVSVDGVEFDMLKLRTMRSEPVVAGEADADWMLHQLGADVGGGSRGVERSTRVGRFLRRTSLDEFPQLLNVLLGEMSLVGPRPERTSYVRAFQDRLYRYGDRHRVKAGMTGWAQVHGLRGKTSLADRVEWDNYYVENWSLWLDFKILAQTAAAILRAARQSK
jgi:exopolysaccharide biosynthesis polyprenyl glycosylphosphotransferase